MKKSMEWHKAGLQNSSSYFDKEVEKLQECLERVNSLGQYVEFKKYQIELAKKRGLVAFDNEKLARNKGKEFHSRKNLKLVAVLKEIAKEIQ